jgi:hypothetical protein
MLKSLTNVQRKAKFGAFNFVPAPTATNAEAIRITDGWAAKNIVTVSCSQLERFGRSPVKLHRVCADPFLELWRTWDAAGLLDIVKTWNGMWVPRFKRGKAGGGEAALSNHSWGSAFDINAREYPLGKPVAPNARIRALVPHAERLGWYWGGRFRSRPDGMHFEFVGEAKP